MTTGTRQRTGGYRIITRRAQQIQTVGFQTLAVAQHVNHLTGTRFLRATQRLVFQRGDPTGFVTRRRVFVNRLIVGDKILLEVIDHGDQFAERFFVATVTHQQLLRPEHLRHFGQHGGAAVGNHVVREATKHRVRGDPGKPV
ncbi:hypothetical protein SDC9_191527 [bioreactor metagenome]|uniref:Uncharacterized protein n=1 Tax=bioreactor metagenome TaxID=1076179 RepID=A0A645HZE5_9ZZZZ